MKRPFLWFTVRSRNIEVMLLHEFDSDVSERLGTSPHLKR